MALYKLNCLPCFLRIGSHLFGKQFWWCTKMKSVLTCPNSNQINLKNVSHIPVLAQEVLKLLAPKPSHVILDMTFGAGGHSRTILNSNPGVKVIALDRDPIAFKYAQKLKDEFPGRVLPLKGKFSDLPRLFTDRNLVGGCLDGILMDLGVSSMQFDTPERGFMLSQNGPLDMRMDQGSEGSPTAADLVAHLDEESLYKILKFYGEEKRARLISRAIVESRFLFKHLNTTKELSELVSGVIGTEESKDKLQRYAHPATKTFQALRIFVNDELNELDFGIRMAHHYLKERGVLVAISFHSLDDTIIKRHFKGAEIDRTPATIGMGMTKHYKNLDNYSRTEMEDFMRARWRSLVKHVVLPSDGEVKDNARSRSAKLRAAQKLELYDDQD